MFCAKISNIRKLGKMPYIGVRGSLEQDISSLRALGPGGGQISSVVHVSTRADFGAFAAKYGFVQEGHTFLGKVWFIFRKSVVSCKRGTHLLKKYGFVQEGHTFLEKVWFRTRGEHNS